MTPRWRTAFGAVALVGLAACGGGSETASPTTTLAPATTTVDPMSFTSSTVGTTTTVTPTTTIAPTTVASTTTMAPTTTLASPPTSACTATDAALSGVLIAYAKGAQPTAVVSVGGIVHAPSDASWARAVVTPKDPSLDGFTAIAHCVGFTWTVVDAGTSGVGCSPPVPPAVRASIGLEC